LAAKNTLDTVNLLAVQAAELGRNSAVDPTQRYMALQGLLQQGESAYMTGYEAYSIEDRQKLLRDIPEAISKAMLSNMITHNPESVKEFIDSGQFDAVLSPEERKKYQDDAVLAIPKVLERRKLEQLYSEIGNNQDLWDAYVKQDPSIMQKLSETDTKFSKNLKELVIAGAIDPEDKADAILELDNMRDAMVDLSKPGKPFRKETALKDLGAYMDKVIEYRKMGLITDSAMNNYRTKFIAPMYQSIVSEGQPSANAGVAGGFLNYTTLGLAGKMANWWFSKNARLDSPTARASVSRAFMDAYDPTVHKTEADVRKLAKDTLVNYVSGAVPSLGLVEGTPNRVQHPDRLQSVVQTGQSDVKGAVPLKGKGVETMIVPSKTDPKKRYRVTVKDGKPFGKPELISE
jgi:hypothetical protein